MTGTGKRHLLKADNVKPLVQAARTVVELAHAPTAKTVAELSLQIAAFSSAVHDLDEASHAPSYDDMSDVAHDVAPSAGKAR